MERRRRRRNKETKKRQPASQIPFPSQEDPPPLPSRFAYLRPSMPIEPVESPTTEEKLWKRYGENPQQEVVFDGTLSHLLREALDKSRG